MMDYWLLMLQNLWMLFWKGKWRWWWKCRKKCRLKRVWDGQWRVGSGMVLYYYPHMCRKGLEKEWTLLDKMRLLVIRWKISNFLAFIYSTMGRGCKMRSDRRSGSKSVEIGSDWLHSIWSSGFTYSLFRVSGPV